MASRLIIARDEEVVSVRFLDEHLIDETYITQVGREIMQVVEQEHIPKIMIDFNNIIHLSSSALGFLIKIHNAVREKDGQLRLCGINEQIIEAFKITNLDQLLSIHGSAEDARNKFS